ncbi:hypothetical protein T265_15576, partial [Opisthorchis viverrini]
MSEEVQQQIRQTTVPAITRNRKMQLISKQEQEALTNIRKDETIVILPADKGSITVIIDTPNCTEKAKQMLNDNTTYKPIDHDPTSHIINRSRDCKQHTRQPGRNDGKTRQCYRISTGEEELQEARSSMTINEDAFPSAKAHVCGRYKETGPNREPVMDAHQPHTENRHCCVADDAEIPKDLGAPALTTLGYQSTGFHEVRAVISDCPEFIGHVSKKSQGLECIYWLVFVESHVVSIGWCSLNRT